MVALARTALVVALACLLGIGNASAQGAAQERLQSADVVDLAWGAWLAGRDQLGDAVPRLEQIVDERIDAEPWSPPVDFALDALIQLEARLSPDLLRRIAERRPVEALVFLAHEPDGAADDILLAMLERERSYRWFGTANLLLRRKPIGVAARLLSGLRVSATLTISDDGEGGGLGGGVGLSIGCGVVGVGPGMPPWPSYGLESRREQNAVVMVDGPQPVSVMRRVMPAGSPPYRGGSNVEAPRTQDRLTYLAALAGTQLPLSATEKRAVRWYPGLDVARARAEFRQDILDRHAGLVRDLFVSGRLTDVEAAALTVEIAVQVEDIHTR